MTMLRRHQALPFLAAGACIALAACGGSTPAASSSHSPKAATESSFCKKLDDAVQAMTTGSSSKMPLSKERHELDHVLGIGITDFTALEKVAPTSLVSPLRTIVTSYKSERHQVDKAGTHQKFVQDVGLNRPARSSAFKKLYSYTSACKQGSGT
jgi:hypothetical protein